MSSTNMVRYEEAPAGLMQWRDPEQVLAEATTAAQSLARVISLKDKPVIFNGETYLEYEDWSTVAKFYGITAKCISSRYVDYGGVTGWEAEAVAIRADGMEVGRAESMCMTDEENWGMVAKYEWQDELDPNGNKIWVPAKGDKKGYYKGKRVKVGEVPKPMFQLRSMAQTRACAKALRSVLSWVVVLGGFKPNVAEEMIESQLAPTEPKKEEKAPVQTPQRASQAKVDTVAGVIEKATFGRGETLWVTIPDVKLVVMVPQEHLRADMLEGQLLSAEATLAKSEKIGEYWAVQKVIKCEPVEDLTQNIEEGEYVDEADGSAEDTSQESTIVDPAIAEGLKDIFAAGGLKKASELPKQDLGTDGKPKIIGPKRAQRLHILISTNHKTTGFTEEVMTKIMHTHPLNIDHLRDLPYHMYGVVEKFATGENTDWKEG